MLQPLPPPSWKYGLGQCKKHERSTWLVVDVVCLGQNASQTAWKLLFWSFCQGGPGNLTIGMPSLSKYHMHLPFSQYELVGFLPNVALQVLSCLELLKVEECLPFLASPTSELPCLKAYRPEKKFEAAIFAARIMADYWACMMWSNVCQCPGQSTLTSCPQHSH